MLVIILFLCSLCNSVYGLPNSGRNKRSENFIPCEEGWYFFDDKCYKIGGYGRGDKATWEESLHLCTQMGGQLASVHSQEQFDFVSTFLTRNMKQTAWIGLNDHQRESFYVWVDGSPFDYNNWEESEPNDHYGEDCVVFGSEPFRGRMGWNDLHCDSKLGYICQNDSNNELKALDPRFCSVGDDRGWKFRDSCFTFVNERKSWKDAELYCQNTFKGHLMMLLDDAYDSFLKYVLPKSQPSLWIGLKTQDTFQQMWTTGWPVSYGHFDERLEELKSGSCILREKEDNWKSVPCDEEHEFVCEKVDPPMLKKTGQRMKCPDFPNDWRDLGGEFCYFIETNRKLSWYRAQEKCIERGGFLGSIHSEEESKILEPFMKTLEVHIGLNNLVTNGGTYVWSDGSQLNFTHWTQGEPNGRNEMCVQTLKRAMTWNDISCSTVSAFMCQVQKVPDEITTETVSVGDEDYMIGGAEKMAFEVKDYRKKGDCSNCVTFKVFTGVAVSILFFLILLSVTFYYFRLREVVRRNKSEDTPILLQSSHEDSLQEKNTSFSYCPRQANEKAYERLN